MVRALFRTRNRDPEPNRSNGLENSMSIQTVYVTISLISFASSKHLYVINWISVTLFFEHPTQITRAISKKFLKSLAKFCRLIEGDGESEY